MDRGREIDNAQNTNAVYIDKYGNGGKTSVKTSNPPGGKSHFSFGWSGQEEQEPVQKRGKKRFDQNNDNMRLNWSLQ